MEKRRGRYIIEFKDIPTERQKMPELPVEERVSNFREVDLGFNQGQAIIEASRCLSCRRCLGCGLCLAVCHPKAIDYTQVDSEIELEAESIIIAPGVERITPSIDAKFGYGKYINVITLPEFERILSDGGPYKGLVLRPYDGEIPRRVAFVPCNAHQDARSLSYAVKAALVAQGKVQGLETHLFFSNAEVHHNEIERYLGKGSKISVRSGKVSAISEDESTKNLLVEFVESRQTRKEEFQLVVLLTTSELPNEIKELARKLGVDLVSCRFQDTADTSLVKTSKEGLFLTGLAFTGEAEKTG